MPPKATQASESREVFGMHDSEHIVLKAKISAADYHGYIDRKYVVQIALCIAAGVPFAVIGCVLVSLLDPVATESFAKYNVGLIPVIAGAILAVVAGRNVVRKAIKQKSQRASDGRWRFAKHHLASFLSAHGVSNSIDRAVGMLDGRGAMLDASENDLGALRLDFVYRGLRGEGQYVSVYRDASAEVDAES